MATYAIGDLQGCLSPLQHLLNRVQFDPRVDTLWCVGDLVNRGPQSLDTLRFIYSLKSAAVVVLGNHDLHLLAVAYNCTPPRAKDTLAEILHAEDGPHLIDWLRQQKLLHISADGNTLMSHAGIPPIWTSAQAASYATEIEALLQDDNTIEEFLGSMYGNQPDTWDNSLQGQDRWRLITNYFTRMRFCDEVGKLELDCKLGPDQPPPGFNPWYTLPNHLQKQQRILFGHWAALEGKTNNPQFIALDTGCVWGGQLSMLRLDDQQWFRCDCK